MRRAMVSDASEAAAQGVPIDLSPRDLFDWLVKNSRISEKQDGGKSWIDKAKSFASAITGGRCSDADFTERLTGWCRTCDLRIVEDDKEYCGGCGCPNWRMSELSTKLRFAEIECPIGKFGKAPAE